MPDPVTGIIGGASLIGGIAQSKAAKKGRRAQERAADASIAEQRRQFDAMQALLKPYVDAGGPALRGLMDLAGLSPMQTNWAAYAQANPDLMAAYQQYQQQQAATSGMAGGAGQPYGIGDSATSQYNPSRETLFNLNIPGGAPQNGMGYGTAPTTPAPAGPQTLEQFAENWYKQRGGDISQYQTDPQAAAIARLEGQPMFQAIARQGEDAILQNASATGGLRGGNTQGALARFRPELLNQFINQQYARLAGLAETGQNAAAGVGSAGLSTGANIGNLLMQRGQASAAGYGAQGQIFANTLGSIAGGLAGGIRPNMFGSAAATVRNNPGIF